MRTALVTGASSGLGASILAELAALGFQAVGTSRAGGALRALDVTDPDSVKRCFQSIERLDLLVNNAGVMLRGAIEETSAEQAHAVFETNFFGLARVTRAALPLLRRQRGRIINLGSIAGGNAMPFVGYYAASKHALLGYSEALRLELKAFGVDVCLVEPSDFRTNLFQAPLEAEPMADYQPLRETLRPMFARALEQAEDPILVAKLVGELAVARSTRLRNRVGKWGRLLPRIKAVLPQRAFELLLAKGLKLDRVRPDANAPRLHRR